MGVWSRVPVGKCRCLFRATSCLLRWVGGSWWLPNLADLDAATGEDLFDEVRQVLCQMEPIGDLPCLRSAFARCGGIILSSVTAHNINLRMPFHPRLGRFYLSIGQEIDDLMGG